MAFTKAEQVALAEAHKLNRNSEGLADFIRRMTPHEAPPRHVMPLIRLLERCRHETVRAVVSQPPRHAKTVTITNGIAWWLSQSPADTHAYVSYNDTQAISKSGPMRALARRAGVSLLDDSASKAEWRTAYGGGVLARGIGSGLTGSGISGLMVVDDAVKNFEEASSQLARDNTHDWFTSVAMTRLEGASVLVNATRWHEDDLIGRLIDQGWESLNLPAIAEADDPIGRQPGEALWPERYPLKQCEDPTCSHAGHLETIRKTIGEFMFASLYQGRPRPRGHAVFGKPTYYDATTFDITGKQIIVYADPAATAKTSGDHSAIIALAVEGSDPATMRAWVLEVDRERRSVPKFMDDLRAFEKRWGSTGALVEAFGMAKAIPQMLDKVDPGAIEGDTPVGDKFTRAQPVAAAWNDPDGSRVLVPMEAPWLQDFLREVARFTGVNDKEDDQCDCLSGAWNSVAPVAVYHRLKTRAPRRL